GAVSAGGEPAAGGLGRFPRRIAALDRRSARRRSGAIRLRRLAGEGYHPGDIRKGAAAMRTSFAVQDMTVHRIVEQEHGFTPLREFLPSLTDELFAENRSWMEETGAYDGNTGNVVLCFQSYVVKTPHHNILVD